MDERLKRFNEALKKTNFAELLENRYHDIMIGTKPPPLMKYEGLMVVLREAGCNDPVEAAMFMAFMEVESYIEIRILGEIGVSHETFTSEEVMALFLITHAKGEQPPEFVYSLTPKAMKELGYAKTESN